MGVLRRTILFLGLVSGAASGWPEAFACPENETLHQTYIQIGMPLLENDTLHCPSPFYQNLSLALLEVPFSSECQTDGNGGWILSNHNDSMHLKVAPQFASPEVGTVIAEVAMCIEDVEDAPLESYELVASASNLLPNGSFPWSAVVDPTPSDVRSHMNTISRTYLERELVASYVSNFSSAEVWRLGGNDTRLQFLLDSVIMSDTNDEHIYHEMLVHPALMAFGLPKDVLIIGGGEGATLREALQNVHVGSVTMVDIDEGLVQFCATHLSAMHRGSFNSSRASLFFEDGAVFVRRMPPELFDVVIVDGVDFDDVGSSTGGSLFGKEFYFDIYKVLRPSGVFVQYMSDVNRFAELQLAGFAQTLDLGVDIPSFLGGGARFTVASKKSHPPLRERISQRLDEEHFKHQWRYLSPTTFGESTAYTARRLKGGGYYGGGGGGYYGGGYRRGGSFIWISGGGGDFIVIIIIFAAVILLLYFVNKANRARQDRPVIDSPPLLNRREQRCQAPPTDDMDWNELSAQQQMAASALGYTQVMWDSDCESNQTSTRNSKDWHELQQWEQQSLLVLGWTPVAWQNN